MTYNGYKHPKCLYGGFYVFENKLLNPYSSYDKNRDKYEVVTVCDNFTSSNIFDESSYFTPISSLVSHENSLFVVLTSYAHYSRINISFSVSVTKCRGFVLNTLGEYLAHECYRLPSIQCLFVLAKSIRSKKGRIK